MKILYIDTFSGVSGDMLLGAFISAGMDFELLKSELSKINSDNYEINFQDVKRNSISAIKADVKMLHHEHVHRTIGDINTLIDSSTLNEKIKSDSKKIFCKIAEAEAKIHNLPVDKVHFHEVGAIDSIIDIVGSAICIDLLGIEKIYSSPIRVGSNAFVNTQHGKIPVPAPATAEIITGYPVSIVDLPYELTTPTGAAIITALSSGILSMDAITIEKIGYGAGGLEIPGLPGMLRVFIGNREQHLEEDEVTIIETNIDDMNPQLYPYIIDKVLAFGANEAYLTPVTMKKGRPGIVLTIIAQKALIAEILEFLYSNTTTIGVRMHDASRKKLKREIVEFNTTYGKIKCKSVEINGRKRIFPEFEECKRIAEEKNIPIINTQRILYDELNIMDNAISKP